MPDRGSGLTYRALTLWCSDILLQHTEPLTRVLLSNILLGVLRRRTYWVRQLRKRLEIVCHECIESPRAFTGRLPPYHCHTPSSAELKLPDLFLPPYSNIAASVTCPILAKVSVSSLLGMVGAHKVIVQIFSKRVMCSRGTQVPPREMCL